MRKYRQYYKKRLRKKKKSIFKNRFFWFSGLGILFFIGMFYLLFFSPVFQINQIIVQGTHFIDKNKIEGLAEIKSDKNILFFQTKSLFALGRKDLQASILDNFYPAETVIIKRHFFKKMLSIGIQEKKPQAIACDQENCFFIDKQGIAFQPTSFKKDLSQKANQSSIPANMAIIRFSDKINIKDHVLDANLLGQILSIFAETKKQKNIHITKFQISSSTIKATLDNQTIIYFSSQKNIERQIEDLFVFLDNLDNQDLLNKTETTQDNGSASKEKSANIQYIDLRFGKIFYK